MAFAPRKPVMPQPDPSSVQTAFGRAMGFQVQPGIAHLPDEQIRREAEEQARYPDIYIGEHGLPISAVEGLFAPALQCLAQWKQARSTFDTEIEPKRESLQALESLPDELNRIEIDGRHSREQEEATWLAKSNNQRVGTNFEEANNRLRAIKQGYGDATPNMRAYNPLYWIALLCIGAAEWLINYDTFLIFIGIPAIAAGATVLLGALLAFSAHAHGEILKQWSYRFDKARAVSERYSSARLLALATLSLLLVVGFAGGSRYAALMHTMSGQMGKTILGDSVLIDINPIRDVLLSLLANVAAWIVGVFIAFYCHDRDPEFMRAQRQYNAAWGAWNSARRDVDRQLETIRANVTRNTEAAKKTAQSRFAAVAAEHGWLTQVDRHELNILHVLEKDVTSNVSRFKNHLSGLVHGSGGRTKLVRQLDDDIAVIKPGEYRGMAVDVRDLLAGDRR